MPGSDPAELSERRAGWGCWERRRTRCCGTRRMAALLEVLDSNEIPYDQNKAENSLTFKDTGSRILFRPVEEFERLRGTNLAWFGVDELTYTQEESWLRLEGRLRDPQATKLCGFGVWTPKGYDWVWRRFIADRINGIPGDPGAAVREPAHSVEDSRLLRAAEDELRREILRAGSDGRVPEHGWGAGIHGVQPGRAPEEPEGESEPAAAVGAGLQRRSDEFGDRADVRGAR